MIDPTRLDTAAFSQASQAADASIIQQEEEKKKTIEQARVAAEQAKQQQALQKDSHAAKPAQEFGAKENMKEIGNALVGGVRDTVSSIATAPERAADMANGQMAKEGDNYRPDWNPLDSGGGDHNPITKTWWGQMLRGGVHFGTTALAITGAVALTRGKVKLPVNGLLKGAVVGAASDTISEYSQGDNATGALAKRFPAIDTPLATHDADHPALKTLKNVVEGMGIGIVADGIAHGIGKIRDRKGITTKPDEEALKKVDSVFEARRVKAEEAAKAAVDKNLRAETKQKYFQQTGAEFNDLTPEQQIELMTKVKGKKTAYQSWKPPGESNEARALRKADERSKNIEDQVVEKGLIELEDPEFRGHKNKPIADSWQGSPNSTGSAYDITKQMKRTSKEWGAENGSTDAYLTPAQAERMANVNGMTAEANQQAARELMGEARYQRLLTDLRANKHTFGQVWGDAFERQQEVLGRDATSKTPAEFWKPILEDQAFQTGGKNNTEAWAMENVVAADLVNGSLFKQLRDGAVGAREIQGVADVFDVDGPMKTMRDRLIVGLTNVKRSRYLISDEFRALQKNDPAKAALDRSERLGGLHEESRSAVDMMMSIAANAETDDFLQATLEAFSMSNKINNWMDYDKWMQGKLRGETTESGIKKTGALIKELQGVMIHSILSGPKTPVRAIMGTSTAAFLRPMSTAVGAAMSGDGRTMRGALATTNAMIQAIPEAFSLFKTKLGSYWAGDIASIRTRFSEFDPRDEHWALMENWAETRGTEWDKMAFRMANLARGMNDNKFLTYSTKIMAATDDAFGYILGRGRAREKALFEAMDLHANGDITEITPNLMKSFEDRFMGEIFDQDGNIHDAALEYGKKEATLTTDLTGFSKGLEQVFSKTPWAKPFFLFARTGVNGLALTAKHTPFFNFLVKEFNDIAFASSDDLSKVAIYGIETAQDLANAKALQRGRLVIGSSVITMAGFHFMNGGLTGNGPQDRQKLQVWLDAGWKPRSIRLGDVWVSYDSFEPFNQILAGVADIGDNQELMGPQWAEDNLLKQSLIVAKTATSKSYLQGLSQFVDLFSGDPKALGNITASLINNTVPLAGLRTEIGRIITPHQRELSSGWQDSIRNRNLSTEYLTSEDLPRKYDLLNGRPINDWDFPTRMFNAISPVQLNLDQGKGRTLLFNSGYDLKMSTYSTPDNVSLANSPKVRSLFQEAIGKQNLEKTLNELAERKDVQDSVAKMNGDRNNGRRMIDPMKAYLHNDLIRNAFEDAKRKAWAELQGRPEVVNLVKTKVASDRLNINTRNNNEAGAAQAQAALEFSKRTNK